MKLSMAEGTALSPLLEFSTQHLEASLH
jgi:hypothetical protein